MGLAANTSSLPARYPLAAQVLSAIEAADDRLGLYASVRRQLAHVPAPELSAAVDWLADCGYLARRLAPPASPRHLPMAPGRHGIEAPPPLQAAGHDMAGAHELRRRYAEQAAKHEERDSKHSQERKAKRGAPGGAGSDGEGEAKHGQEAAHKRLAHQRAHEELAAKHQREHQAKVERREHRAEARVKHHEEHEHKAAHARQAHQEMAHKRQQEHANKRREHRLAQEAHHKAEQKARAAAHEQRQAQQEQHFKTGIADQGRSLQDAKQLDYELQQLMAESARQMALARSVEQRAKDSEEQAVKKSV